MMTTEEYLKIRNNSNQDTMPVLYVYYTGKVLKAMSYLKFIEAMSLWIWNRVGTRQLGKLNEFVFREMDKIYYVNYKK